MNAPLAFDASVKQIVQMCYGHTLVIVPEAIRADGEELLRYIEQEQIAVFDCTPSQLRVMMQSGMGCASALQGIKVLVGGEAIDAKLWSELQSHQGLTY